MYYHYLQSDFFSLVRKKNLYQIHIYYPELRVTLAMIPCDHKFPQVSTHTFGKAKLV